MLKNIGLLCLLWSAPARAQITCIADSCPDYERWIKFSSSSEGSGRTVGFLDDAKLPNYSGALQMVNDRNHKTAKNHVYRPVNPAGGDPLHKDTLVLFLHGGDGSNANEAQNFYRFVVGQGYFVIGLDWLNDASPTTLCTCNDQCYPDFYEQVVDTDGVNHGFYRRFFDAGTPQAGQIGYNSIERRLGLLLKHMKNVADTGHAADWNYFIDNTSPLPKPKWSRIIIAGFSDGSQVASWIFRYRNVKKGLFFSGPKNQLSRDWTLQLNYSPHTCYTDQGIPFLCLNDDSYTSAPFYCTPSETTPTMHQGWPSALIDNMRVFTGYFDSKYEPGVTFSPETLAQCLTLDPHGICAEWSNGWERWNGGSQSRLLVEKGLQETRINQGNGPFYQLPYACNPVANGWTHWLTGTNSFAGHQSTVSDSATSWIEGFRECVWGWMLNN